MKDKWAASAEGYDRFERRWHRYKRVALLMSKYLPKSSRARILDLACGTGVSTLAFAELYKDGEIVGVDASKGMLSLAKRKATKGKIGNVIFVRSDANDFTKSVVGKFDAAICNSAFWQFPNKQRVLDNIKTILKHGGVFVFTIPARPSKAKFSKGAWELEKTEVLKKYSVKVEPALYGKRLNYVTLLKEAGFKITANNKVEFRDPLGLSLEWSMIQRFTYYGNGISIPVKTDLRTARLARAHIVKWRHKDNPYSAWRVLACKPA